MARLSKTSTCCTAPRGARPAKAHSGLAGTGMARAYSTARAPPNHDFRRSAVDTRTERIRALNDDLRQYLLGGLAVITPGVAALGQQAVERIINTIAVYDDFCHANDPHEEHDFGSFQADGQTIFFKIDYYDKNLTYHSPDPSDPSVTERVITIMLADEY